MEVVNFNETADAIMQRTILWLEAGAHLVLVAYPESQVVYAHRGPREVMPYGRGDTIDFRPVFPDFSLPVDDIFKGVDLSER